MVGDLCKLKPCPCLPSLPVQTLLCVCVIDFVLGLLGDHLLSLQCRCLDLESKGHLSPVKPLAMDNLLTSALPTAKPSKPRGVRAAPVELVEEKEVKEKRVKEKEEKSMLDFLKDGWGT